MDYGSALETLGLEHEDQLTKDQVRRAYMRRLRLHPPERDPEGFTRLREAYELVREWIPEHSETNHVSVEDAARIQFVLRMAATERPGAAQGHDSNDALEADAGDERGDDDDDDDRDELSGGRDGDDDHDDDGHEDGDHDDDDHGDDDEHGDARDRHDLWRARRHVAGLQDQELSMSLDDLVEKILVLLVHEEVAEAANLEARYRDAIDTNKDQRASTQTTLRWALTRELLACAHRLPPPVTAALAAAICDGDPSGAVPALVQFRKRDPWRATDAHTTMSAHAPLLLAQIGNALYAPPPPAPEYVHVPEVRSRIGGNAIWAVLGAIVIVLRLCSAVSRSSSSSYEDSNYASSSQWEAHDEQYQRILREMQAERSTWPPAPERTERAPTRAAAAAPAAQAPAPPEPPAVRPYANRAAQLDEIAELVGAMKSAYGMTDEQFTAVLELDKAVASRRCARIQRAFAELNTIPHADWAMKHNYHVHTNRYLAAIDERLALACAATPTKKRTQ